MPMGECVSGVCERLKIHLIAIGVKNSYILSNILISHWQKFYVIPQIFLGCILFGKWNLLDSYEMLDRPCTVQCSADKINSYLQMHSCGNHKYANIY